MLLRKNAVGGNNPTYDIELWETGGGAPLATLARGVALSSATGTVVSVTWNAALLGTASGSAVELRIVGHRSGGSPSNRRTVEVGAVEWNADHQGTPSSELYFLRARYYDPATGRFLAQDPIRAGHPYAYVGNNPINLVDPLGLCGFGSLGDAWDCVEDGGECGLNGLDCVDPRQAADPLIGLLPEGSAFRIFGFHVSYQLVGTCFQYPEACAAAGGAWAGAEAASIALYGFARPEGTFEKPKEGDAFQHCFWSGLITLQVGAGRAENVTTRFEAWGSRNPADQRAYDLHNNERGREFAQYLRGGPSPAKEAAVLEYCRG